MVKINSIYFDHRLLTFDKTTCLIEGTFSLTLDKRTKTKDRFNYLLSLFFCLMFKPSSQQQLNINQ
jgi:hypothetical protein